MLLQIMISINS